MSGASRRKDTRYQARFPALLTFGKRRLSLFTEDLSYRGVFLRTDTPPPLRQLVKVRIVLPFVARAVEMHGMTVHVVDHDNTANRIPGIGIQFYGLDRESREVWETTVRHVENTAPLANDQHPFALPADTPEPIRRRFQRHTAVLSVKAVSKNELSALVARDVSLGGTFIRTNERFALNAPVMICIHHPDNESTYILDGVVRHLQPDGVGIEFTGVDNQAREELREFIESGIIIDEEVLKFESSLG